VFLAREGEEIGDALVPEGMVGLGTICSVTINGISSRQGSRHIPVSAALSRDNGRQTQRFLSVISLRGLVP